MEITDTELPGIRGEDNGALLINLFPACPKSISESMLQEIVSDGANVRLSASFLAPICKYGDRTLK